MAESQVDVDSGTLVLKATPKTVSDKASIHYLRYAAVSTSEICGVLTMFVSSGAVHSTKQITVTAENSYTVYGEFSAPTAKGTWPAFW